MTHKIKRAAALALGTAVLAGALSGCASRPAEKEIFAMDTVMRLTAYGKNGQSAVDAAVREIQRLEKAMDRTDPGSEISRINQGAGKPVSVSGETGWLLRRAQEFSAATGGALDVTIAPVMDAWGFTTDEKHVPSQETLDSLLPLVDSGRMTIEDRDGGAVVTLGAGQAVDLGGIAKGYASERVEAVFWEHGVESALAYLGGNVYAHGGKPDGSAWRVAVQDPGDTESYVGVLSLRDAYAITSGGYQRYFEQDGKIYHHILDPSTGCPADSGLLSVTVVAPADGPIPSTEYGENGGAMADAFSTALFVMGEDRALEFWRQGGWNFDLVLVTNDGRVLVTSGIAGEFEQNKESGYSYETIR